MGLVVCILYRHEKPRLIRMSLLNAQFLLSEEYFNMSTKLTKTCAWIQVSVETFFTLQLVFIKNLLPAYFTWNDMFRWEKKWSPHSMCVSKGNVSNVFLLESRKHSIFKVLNDFWKDFRNEYIITIRMISFHTTTAIIVTIR